ncbi:hypothetical protein [Amycolatopsis sp. CA-126428]|uniref:hypothetical protein n=1 Tax=Amycolatopsis sp. CA-126428 TaxID=2073158 RepID=UPI0018EA83A2|nr:hypothetical protein [Amycolatopsis sp. CA-126428]
MRKHHLETLGPGRPGHDRHSFGQSLNVAKSLVMMYTPSPEQVCGPVEAVRVDYPIG